MGGFIVWVTSMGVMVTERGHNLCAPWGKFGFLPLDVSTFLEQKRLGQAPQGPEETVHRLLSLTGNGWVP